MAKKFEYTVLEMIEDASRNSRVQPLNLGGVAGAGGGAGGPAGGIIGKLGQTYVAYDTDEIASSGIPASGMSLLDNLNHIRYRLDNVPSAIVVDDLSGHSVSNVNRVTVSGGSVSDLGGGRVLMALGGSGGDSTYLRLDTANNPLTHHLEITNNDPSDTDSLVITNNQGSAGYLKATDSYGIALEQIGTHDMDMLSTYYVFRYTTGANNTFPAPVFTIYDSDPLAEYSSDDGGFVKVFDEDSTLRLDINPYATINGTILLLDSSNSISATGKLLSLKNQSTEKFSVNGLGTVNIPTGQTYNINGSPHVHDISVITGVTVAGSAIVTAIDAAAQRTSLGLASGGAGDIWVEKAGDTMAGDLNFAKYKAIAMSCDNGTTLPATAAVGQWFLHTPTGRKVLYQYNGTTWTSILNLGTSTLYVHPSGTDDQEHGTATGASAYKTVNYAYSQISPLFSGNITIIVGAGTYDETLALGGKFTTGNFTITIQGTLTTLDTGTVTSAVMGTGATRCTITDSTKAWTVDQFKGKLVTVNGVRRTILSNTADTLTLTAVISGITPSGAYTISDYASTLYKTTSGNTITQLPSPTTHLFTLMKIGGNTASGIVFAGNGGNVNFTNVWITIDGTSQVFYQGSNTTSNIQHSYITTTVAGAYFINAVSNCSFSSWGNFVESTNGTKSNPCFVFQAGSILLTNIGSNYINFNVVCSLNPGAYMVVGPTAANGYNFFTNNGVAIQANTNAWYSSDATNQYSGNTNDVQTPWSIGEIIFQSKRNQIETQIRAATSQTVDLTQWQDSSNTILNRIDVNGGAVFNEQGAATPDFRIEGDTDPNLFNLDSGNDAITIGSATELAKLAVDGNADEKQFVVQANATQTNNLTEWQNSSAVALSSINPTGDLYYHGLTAHAVLMNRHTTTNTAGNSLTMQAGGATSGATDKGAGQLILQPGLSTGMGTGSVRVKRLTRTASTSTSDNSFVDAHVIAAEKSVTAEGSVDLFEVALPAGSMAAGYITYQFLSTDGTDYQAHSGHAQYTAINVGGVYTTEIKDNTPTDESSIGTKGLTTDTWAITPGSNKITISVTIACSLIIANDIKIYYTVHNGGRNDITQL